VNGLQVYVSARLPSNVSELRPPERLTLFRSAPTPTTTHRGLDVAIQLCADLFDERSPHRQDMIGIGEFRTARRLRPQESGICGQPRAALSRVCPLSMVGARHRFDQP